MVAGHVLTHERGKSELHRARRWVIPSGGDSKESATEIDRPVFRVRMER